MHGATDFIPVLFLLAVAAGIFWLIFWLDRRRKNKAWGKTKEILTAIEAKGKPRPPLVDPLSGTLVCDARGLRLDKADATVASIEWNSVEEIVAFRRDVFSFHAICLAFRPLGSDAMLEVHEKMPGFDAMLAAVEAHFGVKPSDWFRQVNSPEYEGVALTIWQMKTLEDNSQPLFEEDESAPEAPQ